MPEIIGTFLRTEQWDERANCSIEAWDSSRRNLAQECLEFAVRHFDRIEIGRVFRQVARVAPAFSIASRMPGPRWTRQLSITTMSLRNPTDSNRMGTALVRPTPATRRRWCQAWTSRGQKNDFQDAITCAKIADVFHGSA